MANTVLKDVWRPALLAPGTEAAGEPAPADHLIARIDYNNDNGRVVEAMLKFADYAGLEAEWEAGTATTVLEAALLSWLTDPGFPADPLPVGQRAIRGFQIAVAP